jgi:sec-independent protein translocase protein TatA
MQLGPTELIIILVIVIVLFGVGRIGKIAGEMGSGIRAFREGLRGDDDKNKTDDKAKDKTNDSESIPPPN